MPKVTSTAEDRSFKMHPQLLMSVIRNQAGSIGKAILELVMNSLDAGAIRLDAVPSSSESLLAERRKTPADCNQHH